LEKGSYDETNKIGEQLDIDGIESHLVYNVNPRLEEFGELLERIPIL